MNIFEQDSIALFQIRALFFLPHHGLPKKNVLPGYLLDIKYERFPQWSLA